MHYQEVPYWLTDSTLTVSLDGRPEIFHRDAVTFEQALDVLRDEDLPYDEKVARLVKLARPVQLLADIDDSRVTISGRRVLFDGEGVPSALTNKILEIQTLGLPLAPWKRFMVRLFSNPNRSAQAELNQFLDYGNLPITEDGCFLAYKRVRENYRDVHSGKFDNSVGEVVSMPRSEVDADRNRTCSSGLHFCSQEYLRNFLRGSGRIMVLKIDPADVVSIPTDYNNTKGRCWRYEVVGELSLDTEAAREAWGVYEFSFDDIDDDTDWDDPEYWDTPWADDVEDDIEAELDDIDWGNPISHDDSPPQPQRRGRFAEWFRKNR